MNLFFNVATVAIIATSIIVLPSLLFKFQENQLLNIKMEIPIEAIKIIKNEAGLLNMNGRLELIKADNPNIERLTLQTGDKYSLYEARKQCFKELSKISMLKMDIYGPSNRGIKVVPYMIIDSETPVYSLIVWQGTLEINKIIYDIILDEESGKIIQLKVSDTNQTDLQDKLNEEWKRYFFDN
jgi:hypothetical protein